MLDVVDLQIDPHMHPQDDVCYKLSATTLTKSSLLHKPVHIAEAGLYTCPVKLQHLTGKLSQDRNQSRALTLEAPEND